MVLYIILGAATIAVVVAAMVVLNRSNKFETDFGLPVESTPTPAEEPPAAPAAPAAQPEEQFA